MKIEEAKAMDMVDYLSSLGHEPRRISGNNYWYHSPLAEGADKTPSFKVNRKLNTWYDWSEGRNTGGDIIDFGVLYHKCGIGDFLRNLNHGPRRQPPEISATDDQKAHIEILTVKPLDSPALIAYLQRRNIPRTVYSQYCSEVLYRFQEKSYYSIGFKNDEGGYELRNAYSKLSTSPKAQTFLDNGAHKLALFEGFINFLSYKSMHESMALPQCNYLILNSTVFFEKNLPLMQAHQKVLLYLDNDATGQKFSHRAMTVDPTKFDDKRALYHGFNDLNEYIMHRGSVHQHRLQQ